MKLSRIALAMLVAAPLAAANAGITVTPLLLGYTFQDTKHNNGVDHLTTGPEIQDDLFVGAAIGVELTPWLGFETEYNQVKGDVDGTLAGAEYKQQQINGNFYVTSDLITKNYDSKIKPYVLLGAGHYKYTFANTDNLIMSCTVLAVIILLNRVQIIWVKSSAILIALVIGYILAGFMGHLNFSVLHDAPLIQIPTPMHFGLSFSWSLFIPMAFIYLVTSLEAIGDVTATSKISNQPVDGPVWMQRIKGGVLVNGANSLLAGIFNTFPSSVFAQNNGVIQLTGVASRYVGIWIAVLLIILGLFPAVAAVIQAVPQAVLGGAVMVMFGAVAASGINILSSIHLDRRALLIIAISLALGLGVAQVPQILEHLPELFKNIFSSGVATGGIAALILNVVLPETQK
jgi:uracil-xanthine permease